MNHGSRHSALLQLHMSVLLLAGSALFPRLLPIATEEIIWVRSVIGGGALALLAYFMKQSFKVNLHEAVINIGLGLLMTVHWLTYYESIKMSSVAIGCVALFTSPVITVFIEPLINRTRIILSDVLAGLAVFIGVLIMVPEFSLENEATAGIAVGVFSAFIFALRNILQRRYLRHRPALPATFYQILVVAIVLSFIANPNEVQFATYWHYWLALGVVFTALPHGFYLQALAHLSAKTASIISCMTPLYAALLAAVTVDGIPHWQTIVGGLIIVSVSSFESLRVKKSTVK